MANPHDEDFKVNLIINNHLDSVLADTGAKVSVCGVKQARKWDLISRMSKTNIKIKPYKSKVIPALGESRCSVSFGNNSVPVVWHIIDEDCEPVLAGIPSKQLGIIKFQSVPKPFMPVNMIKGEDKEGYQEILSRHPECFSGVGKLQGYQVKLHTEAGVKPVAEPPRRIPYHLKERVENAISLMLQDDVIEEHPCTEQAPWVSNVVIAPKDDGDIRVTLDAKRVNKALKASNFPIPRQEDIKVKLSGAKKFSKLDLKSAFWQLELAPESRAYTVFHAAGKLFRYKRLVMGLKPSQGELNAALQPLFAHIPDVHVIHDDLVVATKTSDEHLSVVEEVLAVLSRNGLTLNASKCQFGQSEIRFWGMIVSADGIRPDPEKVEALNHITPPANKAELTSFLCMMQANAEFIPGFATKAAKLRELTQKSVRFSWKSDHQACFDALIKAFKKETLLCYFDPSLPTYILVDAHYTGLGAILSQGYTLESARPVAVVSRATNKSEKQYPQLDLEGASVDFGLRRFREYLVGSPHSIKVISDHKPLVAIFNSNRKGSIRTQRIALRHQDVPYTVEYHKGAYNQADFMSRHAKPLSKIPKEQQAEAEELNNLLYSLHVTPVMDQIGISKIAKETSADKTLSKIKQFIRKGQGWIPKSEPKEVQRFKQILPELTITGNGIILKDDRIVLPVSLQQKAIELAHRGAHPGQSGMERRLRYHFFFHNMYRLVEKFVQECPSCSMFVKKPVKETLTHHQVPNSCWETVAVDLYGPMPSSKHIVVVQDLASRYPAAKLVSSTKADKVLPVLADIYDTFGNPEVQISDNGPPFNSAKMRSFAEARDIQLRHTPPLHPNANPAETVMKPIGKAMKTALQCGMTEKDALQHSLTQIRQTPHVATGVPPANYMFRDGARMDFPRKKSNEMDIAEAKARDLERKEKKQEDVNSSKYRKQSNMKVGDLVYVQNYKKTSKFDPTYLPEPYEVTGVDKIAKRLTLKKQGDEDVLIRHPDHVKPFYGREREEVADETIPSKNDSEAELLKYSKQDEDSYEDSAPGIINDGSGIVQEDADGPLMLRRSTRERRPNPRYANGDYIMVS